MRANGMDPAAIGLAATDLANHLACPHVTTLDRAAAEGRIEPPHWRRPGLDALRERGIEHERAYLDHLEAGGLRLRRAGEGEGAGLAWTRAAMRSGAEVIVQAALGEGRWSGRADVLRRVVEPLQGRRPEFMHVVAPRSGFAPESFRVDDYLAYARWVRRRLEGAIEAPAATYPEPVPHCDVCRWWPRCDRRRHDDDHLSIVAGISRLQRRELESREVVTLTSLAELATPLPWSPRRGTRPSMERVRDQARVQLAGRRERKSVFELLALAPDQGLARLPAPSPGDLFLDLEGDPYVGDHGREYLFGMASTSGDGRIVYASEWALRSQDEKWAFENVIDAILIHLENDPGLHVFHYGPYDLAALKRLMGRYATRERAIDRMLRAERFVDLLPVVRQSLRASVERYSIKDLESFYDFTRDVGLREASAFRAALERALELGDGDTIDEETRQAVERYNRDDCLSALRLRGWLEDLRARRTEAGAAIPRPAVVADGAPAPELDERERATQELAARLVSGIPADPGARSREQRARALLADLLEWHRREEKAPWWEYYRLRDLLDDALMDEKAAIAGLEFVAVAENGRRVVERYSFPPQETSIREEDELHTRELGDAARPRKVGTVVHIDPVERWIEIARSSKSSERLSAVFEHTHYDTRELAKALVRLGRWVDQHGIDAPGPERAARDLLLGRPPRLRLGVPLRTADETVVEAAVRIAPTLDQGVLVIQGPPGAGKTFTSAQMICALVREGKKVGVCAHSHAVIRNLLEDVMEAADRATVSVRCMHKTKKVSEAPGRISECADNEEPLAALAQGTIDVLGGTAWLWSRQEFHEAVDVLFVDEAGQMSLANALACAQGAKSLVLVGDPQQLEQPTKGSHPDGAGVSALEHALEGRKTLSPERGLFLDETWRLHPSICAFTSEQFYENKLHARAGLERQAIESARIRGAGLWLLPVEHQGNTTAAAEEVAEIRALLGELLETGAWIDAEAARRPLTLDDLLIVAPYNAQVADLVRALPRGARVGTVDRFQGQQAPIVIVSMTTSAPEDAPRGMEFLYSLDRLNVATSRARAACVLVASPRLFEPECRNPRQMQLANGFCRYLERARTLAPVVRPSAA